MRRAGGSGGMEEDIVDVMRTVDASAAAIISEVSKPGENGWLPLRQCRVISALPPRFVRIVFVDGSQAAISIVRRGNVRSTVSVEHGMLPTDTDTDMLRERWYDALRVLSRRLGSDPSHVTIDNALRPQRSGSGPFLGKGRSGG